MIFDFVAIELNSLDVFAGVVKFVAEPGFEELNSGVPPDGDGRIMPDPGVWEKRGGPPGVLYILFDIEAPNR